MEPRGIEPRFTECDSVVIPLDHGPGLDRSYARDSSSTPRLTSIQASRMMRGICAREKEINGTLAAEDGARLLLLGQSGARQKSDMGWHHQPGGAEAHPRDEEG